MTWAHWLVTLMSAPNRSPPPFGVVTPDSAWARADKQLSPALPQRRVRRPKLLARISMLNKSTHRGKSAKLHLRKGLPSNSKTASR